jgi:hypothetical protein
MGPNEASTWTDDIDFESDKDNKDGRGIKSESERSNSGARVKKDHFFCQNGPCDEEPVTSVNFLLQGGLLY